MVEFVFIGKLCLAMMIVYSIPHSDSHLSHRSFILKMLSPLASGLFHRAIAESGTAVWPGLETANPLLSAQVSLFSYSSYIIF